MSIDLSVVIPAYNERSRIGPTLVAIDEFLAQTDKRYEIVVVDDGSNDETATFVRMMSAGIPSVRCVAYLQNRGKGNAVRIGMLAARGAIRIMCDADGSTPASEIPRLIHAIEEQGADIAIGSRYADGASVDQKQPFYRIWWSRLANQIVQWSLVPGISDTQCGFKAFRADAAFAIFHRTQIDGWAFDLEVLALASRLGLGVREVAVHWSDDPRSKINPLGDAWKVFTELMTIRRNLRRGAYGQLSACSG